MALRPADESNNFRAQENPSHTAMATSPANASAIKYTVMSFSLDLNQSCGMIACAIISGANPISIKWRLRAGGDVGPAACRRVSRVPGNERGEPYSAEASAMLARRFQLNS